MLKSTTIFTYQNYTEKKCASNVNKNAFKTRSKRKRIINSLASHERKEVKECRNAMDENIPGLENLVCNRNHCANRVTLCPIIDSLQNHRPELSQVHFRAVKPRRVTGEHETVPRHLSHTLHPACNGKT